MKATLRTSCEATSRSLTINQTTKKGIIKEQRNKRLGLIAVLFPVLFVSLLFARLDAAEPQADAKTTGATDILRQDVLRFVGPMAERRVTLPEDSFLVRLNRNVVTRPGENATSYGMLVRGLDDAERTLLRDAQDGKWDDFDLFRAAMVAEGVRDPNKIRQYEARMDALLASIDARTLSKPELTRKLFEALHRDVLTSPYDIDCTHLARVLETGHFNCVSATVLFNALGEKAGLDVVALEMPGHALSRVRFVDGHGEDRSMNLETTCPNWFSLQREADRAEATVHRVARPTPALPMPVTGNRQSAAPNVDAVAELDNLSKKLREITPVQLIATIYYNQGVDYLAQQRFAEAATANVKALHLDPSSETAWGNLLATINNWAIKLTTESKRYDLAATLLDQGVYLDPNYDKFRANQLHVYYHWIRDLALEGRTADAQTVFALADKRLPGDADLANLMRAIAAK